MLNRQCPSAGQDGEGYGKRKQFSTRTNVREEPASGAGWGPEDPGAKGRTAANESRNVSEKKGHLDISSADQGFGEIGVRDFVPGMPPEQTQEPKIRGSNQIEGFGPKQTQASYLSWNLSVTAKIGPLLSKFECERSIKDSAFLSFGASPFLDKRWRGLFDDP